MSLKSSKPERKKPRAMPVETIVTRFKSAQQKQLLEKELRSTRKSKITKPTKIPQTNNKSSEQKLPRHTKVQNLNKKLEKFSKTAIDEKKIENKEYYPNKLKRKVLNARTFLAPKHSFKIVCGTKSSNKRKLHIPQRDKKYIKEQKLNQGQESLKTKTPSPELTITDMVRIIEEDGSLDDEDLLEILTCPSPVWWEEPPDGYIEEPVSTQSRPIEKQQSIKEQMQEEQRVTKEESNNNENINKINLQDSIDISINNRDTNFVNKRSHLEILLGNIKNKVVKPIKKDSHKNELKTTKESIKDMKIDIKRKSKVKSNSECTEEDFVEFRDDDILTHLENLEIPIEANQKEVIDNEEEEEVKSRRMSIESYKSDKNMSEEYLDMSLLEEDETEYREIELKNVNSIEINESISTFNISSHSEVKSDADASDEILNISDSKSDCGQSLNEIEETNEMKSDLNEIDLDKTDIMKNNEYVTVYKILNNDSVKDLHENIEQIDKRKDLKDTDGKIDSYYKQCKKISVSKTSKNENEMNQDSHENKSIVISESDKVKYCFICSSIFDTESCNYCLRKNLKRKFDKCCDKCGSDVDTKDFEHSSEND